ncbi:hypothetical protein [Spartinivicinus ruber]|uniref:hypothetical protein n=1 Tax=Spartinivicinus ruber TaxID=2683272 RepID=UPI0013D298FC|nr:hypothetical protein [Spartinivicinus ruber]
MTNSLSSYLGNGSIDSGSSVDGLEQLPSSSANQPVDQAPQENVIQLNESAAAQRLFQQQVHYPPQQHMLTGLDAVNTELVAATSDAQQLVSSCIIDDHGVAIDEQGRELIKQHLETVLNNYVLHYGKWEIKSKLRRLPKDPVGYFAKTGNEQRPVNGKWASPKHLAVFNKLQGQMPEGALIIEDGRIKVKEPFPNTVQGLANYLNRLVGYDTITEEKSHNSNKSMLTKLLLKGDQVVINTLIKYVDVIGSEKNNTTKKYRVLFKPHDNPFTETTATKSYHSQLRIRANTQRAAEVIEHETLLLRQLLQRLETYQKQVAAISRGGLFEQAIQQIATKADNHFRNHPVDYKIRDLQALKIELSKCRESLDQQQTHLATKDGIKQLREQLMHYQSYVNRLGQYVDTVKDLSSALTGYKAVSDTGKAISLLERLENRQISWRDYMPADDSQSGKVKLSFQKFRAKWWAFVARSSDWQHTIHYNRKNDIISSIKIMYEQTDKLNELLITEGKSQQLDKNALLFRVELADRLLKISRKLKNKSAIRFGFVMLKRKALEKLLDKQLGLEEGSVRNFKTSPNKKGITGGINRLTERAGRIVYRYK